MRQQTPKLIRRFVPQGTPETPPVDEEVPELIRQFTPSTGEALQGAVFRGAEGVARGIGGLVAAPGIALEAVGADRVGGAVRRAGQAIGTAAEGLRPEKEAASETFMAELAGAVGSGISFVGPTAGAQLGLRAMRLAPRAAQLIAGVGTGVAANASGGYFEALAETGDHQAAAWAAEQARSSGAGPAGARRAYEEVLNATGNREQAYMAFLMQGTLVGPLEAVGLGKSAGTLAKIMARADVTRSGAVSAAMAKLMIEESAQEGYGQLVANLGAHLIGYDEDRQAWEGVGKAALLGGLAGVIVGGPIELLANVKAGGEQRLGPGPAAPLGEPATPPALPSAVQSGAPGQRLFSEGISQGTSDEGPLDRRPASERKDEGHPAKPATGGFSVFEYGTSDEEQTAFTRPYQAGDEKSPLFRGRSERPIVKGDASRGPIAGQSIFRHGTSDEGIVEQIRPFRPGDETLPTFAGRVPEQPEPDRFVPPLEINEFPGLEPKDREIEQRFTEDLQRNLSFFKGEYQRRFGNVLNVDNARELSSDYLRDRTRALAVHEPGSAFIKDLYRDLLSQPPPPGKKPEVLFTAGGTGAGKTSGIKGVPELKKAHDEAQIVYDTNMNGYASSKKKLDQALAAGKQVQVVYVYRDPVEALTRGALTRAMRQEKHYGTGRTVPLEIHAETHTASLETVKRLMAAYAGNVYVQFRFVDNTRGPGRAQLVPFDSLPTPGYSPGELHAALRQALEEERSAGRISEAVYQGFAGGVQETDGRDGKGVRKEPERARAPERAEAEVARPPPALAFEEWGVSIKALKADGWKHLGELHDGPPAPRSGKYLGDLWRKGDEYRAFRVEYGWAKERSEPIAKATLKRSAPLRLSAAQSVDRFIYTPAAVGAEELGATSTPDRAAAGAPVPAPVVEAPPSLPEPTRPSLIPASPGPEATVELVGGRSLPVRYAIVDATKHLIPSHDARAGFKKNPQGDINERPYDDPVEGRPMRATVEAIAQAPKPNLLTTDTPSPVDGPPIVTTRGVVLGGNARAMGVQLAYHRGGAQAELLRTAMLEAAKRFGIGTFGFASDPMLVRMVAEGQEGAPGELSRVLNESLTTAKGVSTEAVSRGSKITAEVAQEIGTILGDGTLREALNEQGKARDVARALIAAGAMTQRDVDALFDPTRGIPTAAGKQVIEDALLGSVITDVRVLAETPPSARNALLRTLPSLITLRGRIPELPTIIRHVAQGAAEVSQTGAPLADVLDQQVLPGIDVGWKSDETAVGVLRSLLTEKPTRFAGRLERLAQRSREVGAGQASFITEENLPIEEQLRAEFGALEPAAQLFAFPGAITDDLRALITPSEPLRASAIRARARPTPVPVQSWVAKAAQRFGDYFEPVARLQVAAPPLVETENVYQAETLRRGRTKDRIEREIREPFLKPILALMRGRKLTQVEVDEFLLARHAEERNRTVAERQPEVAPLVKKRRELERLIERLKEKEEDFHGAEGELERVDEQIGEFVEEYMARPDAEGIGMSNEEANEILAKVAEDPRRTAFEAVGALVDKLHKHVRNHVWLDSGLESEATVEALEARWKRYVPARTDMGEGMDTGTSSRMGRQFKPALGRKTRADHPLAFSFIQAEQAIGRAERNTVRQALLRYVRTYAEQLEGVIREVPVPTRRALVAGAVETVPDPFFLGRPDVVTVRREGETIGLEVDRRYLDLAKALNAGPERIEGVTRLMSRINKIRAALITRYRPVFWPRNLIRDVGATWYAGQELGARFALAVTKDVPKAMRVVATGKGAWTEYLDEFQRAGAPISFLDMAGLEQTLERMQSELTEAGPGLISQSRAGWRRLKEVMEKMADVSENATRLSAFVHAREDLGWSVEKAAAWAKELQNFERKGLWGNHVNAWYMFANAGIQGGRRFVQALRSPLVQRTLVASFVASMAWDQIMRAVAGEAEDGEDWWDKVPDYEKRGNFVVMYPDGSGRRVTIPSPFVWGAFNNAGQELSAALSGDKDPWEAGASIVAGFANALSPLGDLAGQGDSGALSALVPDVGQPAFELATNRDWRGKPIAPSGFGQEKPDSESFWPDADPRAIAAARWLNRHTGGSSLKPGVVDVSPESFEHVLRFFSAGLPEDIKALHDLGRKAEGRDLITSRDVPLVRSFVRNPSLFESGRQQGELMRELRAEERGRRHLASPGRRPPADLLQLLADGRAVEKQREVRLKTIEGLPERTRLPALQELDLAASRWNKRAREFMLEVRIIPTPTPSSP